MSDGEHWNAMLKLPDRTVTALSFAAFRFPSLQMLLDQRYDRRVRMNTI